MPRKTLNAGDVLTASDVNTFLMDQSVMTFADSAARGSAIGTATEGMLTYLEDTDAYQSWNGSAWVGVGGAGSGNAIINGAFEINQRGFTTTTTSLTYIADRWRVANTGGTVTTSLETFTPGTAPVSGYEGKNYIRCITTGQSGATAEARFLQNIEDVRTLAGQTATISFWAKAATGTPKVAVNLTQNFGSGGSPSALVQNYAGQVTISTSWVRYSVTVAVASISGKTLGTANDSRLGVSLWVSAGTDNDAITGSLGIQSNTFDIWGVQLEAGSVATPFKRNANSLQGELAACQRYYVRQTSALSSFARFSTVGGALSATTCFVPVPVPVQLRTRPTSIDFSTLSLSDGAGGGFVTITAATIDQASETIVNVSCTVASGLTQHRTYAIQANNTTSAFIGFSAEL